MIVVGLLSLLRYVWVSFLKLSFLLLFTHLKRHNMTSVAFARIVMSVLGWVDLGAKHMNRRAPLSTTRMLRRSGWFVPHVQHIDKMLLATVEREYSDPKSQYNKHFQKRG